MRPRARDEMPRARRGSPCKPAKRLDSRAQSLASPVLARALLKGGVSRDALGTEKSKVMKNLDASRFDVVLFAVGPLMAAQLFGLMLLVLSCVHR